MLLAFTILFVTIILFIHGRLRADVVALMALLLLFLTGIIDLPQALSGFSDPTVIMIAVLFVVGEGLSRTGVTAYLGQKMIDAAGSSVVRLLIVTMVGAAILSAFISNTGTVAALMPAVIAAAWHIGSLPSRLLMPLAYSANTGGLLTLTGTPPNIIVSDTLSTAGLAPFGYFEYALIGIPLLGVATIYMLLIGRKLLPVRKSDERPPDLSESLGELAQDYTLPETFFWLRVRKGSGLVGLTLEEAAIGRDYNISVLRIERPSPEKPSLAKGVDQVQRPRPSFDFLSGEKHNVPGPKEVIQAGDVLLVKGEPSSVNRLMLRFNVGLQRAETADDELVDLLLSHEVGLAEVLLAPRSTYRGRSVSESHFAEKYNVQVIGIRRGNNQVDHRHSKLRFGDALLVRGRWEDIELLRREKRNFVVVGSPDAMARQVIELNPQAVVAVASLLVMIVLMVTGTVPTVIAALIAAVAMILGRCLTMEQAYRAINWSGVVLIAAMIPMSIALQVTGGAEFLANGLVESLGTYSPMVLLAGVFTLTMALSQVMNNSASTVLVAPVVFQTAIALNLSPYPLLMAVAVGASTAFLTPIGTTTNLMVSSPAGYRFTDYFKVGAPLSLLFLLISVILIPIIWGF